MTAFKVDQLQVAPGLTGTRSIQGDSLTGALVLADALIASGLSLSQMAALRTIKNFLVVGAAGSGAEFTSLYDALAASRSIDTITDPFFVLMGPGVYDVPQEIVVDKNAHIFGAGASLVATANVDVLSIKDSPSVTPRRVILDRLKITNSYAGKSCVNIEGGAASNVGSDGIFINDCSLLATNGNYPLKAAVANRIMMSGGTLQGSNSLAQVKIENCSYFVMDGVKGTTGLVLSYDSGAAQPAEMTSLYRLVGCPDLAKDSGLAPNITVTLNGIGNLQVIGCSGTPSLGLHGDLPIQVFSSQVGNIALYDTTGIVLSGSKRGTATVSGLGPVYLNEPLQEGIASFVGVTFQDVTFAVPHENANYAVHLELSSLPAGNEQAWITNKTAAGFRIRFTSAQTLTVGWSVHRIVG